MGVRLRIYPLPYLTVPVRQEVLDIAENAERAVVQSSERFARYAGRVAQQQALARGAFADAYRSWDSFWETPLERYRFDLHEDFRMGGLSIKLVSGSPFIKSGNTGPTMTLRISRRTFDDSPAQLFIPTVVGLPDVVFVGALRRDDLLVHASGLRISIPVNSGRLRCLSTVAALEERRIAGRFR